MKKTHSIRYRLTASFWLLFVVIVSVGLFGLDRLNQFDSELSDLSDQWLKNTRRLGDLSNYTSDFQAAEGMFLLAGREADVLVAKQEMQSLDAAIAKNQQAYENIQHGPIELEQYQVFLTNWRLYRSEAEHIIATATNGDKAEAINLYMTSSRVAFAAASEILNRLTERNNQQAKRASDRADAAFTQARVLMVIAASLGAAIALAILTYVKTQVTNPLLGLAECMGRLARGEVDVEIPNISWHDEIGKMARAVIVFRNNAVELKLKQVGLAQQASMLEEKLAHEQRLSQEQRNFISMASHEFRTPMTIIDGHAQRLINTADPLTRANVVDRAQKIRAAIKRMSVMISGLLQSSKIMDQDPSLYFHPTQFEFGGLVKEICKIHKEITQCVTIVEEICDERCLLWGDRNLLSQALSNLIANAVKYSPNGGDIVVTVRGRVNNALEVSVRDYGIGIPREDHDKIFKRYFRAANVGGIVGTGVGLYLVKIVVDLHGGAISVDSEENQGACFTLRLPLAKPLEVS